MYSIHLCTLYLPCRLESELKSLSDQLSAAPKQHQLESLQSAMSVVQSSLQQAKDQLQLKEEATAQLNEKLVQVRIAMDVQCAYIYMYTNLYCLLNKYQVSSINDLSQFLTGKIIHVASSIFTLVTPAS